MRPSIYITIRIAIVLVVVWLLIRPYNWLCMASGSCKPFYLSYYIPKRLGGEEINVKFEVTNYDKSLEFASREPSIKLYGNQKKSVSYYAKNNSKRILKFNPTLFIEPEYAKKYVIRYDCLCSKSYKIKPKEEIRMTMEFEIDDEISKDPKFDPKFNKSNPEIIIRYKVDPKITFN